MNIDEMIIGFYEQLPADFVITIEAERFLHEMKHEFAHDLAKWLDARAVEFVAAQLRRQLHSDRVRARYGERRAAYRGAVDEFDPTDDASIEVFQQRFATNHQNLWRRLGEMTGAEHLFVAESYQNKGKRMLMEASFHRAIAKKVGNRRTDEVFTETELIELRERCLGETSE